MVLSFYYLPHFCTQLYSCYEQITAIQFLFNHRWVVEIITHTFRTMAWALKILTRALLPVPNSLQPKMAQPHLFSSS